MRRPLLSCMSTVTSLAVLILIGCTETVERGGKSGSPEIAAFTEELPKSEDKESTTAQQLTSSAPVEEFAATSEPKPEKPKRASIYDAEAKGQDLIATAVRKAKRDHKQVLIEWCGNWCGWCHLLHDTFTKTPGGNFKQACPSASSQLHLWGCVPSACVLARQCLWPNLIDS